jgi:hypothetical protein
MPAMNELLRNTTALQAISFVLFLVALPLVALGTMEDIPPLWWLGLLLLVVAGILPPASRFMGGDEEDEEDGGGEGRDEAGGESAEETVRPPEGPVGPPTAAPGRDLGRARVQEQRQRASEVIEEVTDGDRRNGTSASRDERA